MVGILFIGFDLSAFQTALQQMASDSKLLNSGGPVIIDPKKSPAEAIYIAHPSAKGKKAIEAVPGAEATPAALAAAGDGPVPVAVPLLAAGSDRWAMLRKRKQSGGWVVGGGWWVGAGRQGGHAAALRRDAALPGDVRRGRRGAGPGAGPGLGWTVRRSVAQPLAALSRSLAAVAQGDLTHPVQVRGYGEIGQPAAQAEHLLNNCPRKILNFHSPHEVFSKRTLDVIAGVALQA